jgi:uracil-DNA glycosylase
MEPGQTLLAQALGLIAAHPAWREVLDGRRSSGVGAG